MKIAICFSGIPKGNIENNLNRFHYKFKNCDYFFSTWKTQEKCIPQMIKNKCIFFEEPLINYHPLVDIPNNELKTWKQVALKEKAIFDKIYFNRTLHHTKQLLGHAYLIDLIPNDYDMIIRTRFDTFISTEVDFNSLLDKSYENSCAIGFGVRLTRYKKLDTLYEIPKLYTKIENQDVSSDWGHYIMDPLIFHPRKLFNTNLVFELHNNKKLQLAENGWYQILSEPFGDNHHCYYGGAQIEKYLSGVIYK